MSKEKKDTDNLKISKREIRSGDPDLFFSEYAEGSSYNKYLEIYNPTSENVQLNNYAFPNVSNAPTITGEYEFWNTFKVDATIAPGDVYVIAHPDADQKILAYADQTHKFLSNGDDGYKLVKKIDGSTNFVDGAVVNTDFSVIDTLGDWQGDPGVGWNVAGVPDATKDHTLVRKSGIVHGNSDWTSSAGTDAENSEWIVKDNEDWDDLGSHNEPEPEPEPELVNINYISNNYVKQHDDDFRIGTYNINIDNGNNKNLIGVIIEAANMDMVLLQEAGNFTDTPTDSDKSNFLTTLGLDTSNYSCLLLNAQSTSYGGDLAIVYKNTITINQINGNDVTILNDPNNSINSGLREAMLIQITTNNKIINIINVHLDAGTSDFASRLNLVKRLNTAYDNLSITNKENLIIAGDFNWFGTLDGQTTGNDSAYKNLLSTIYTTYKGDPLVLDNNQNILDSQFNTTNLLEWSTDDTATPPHSPNIQQYASSMYQNKLIARLDCLMLGKGLESYYRLNSYTVIGNPFDYETTTFNYNNLTGDAKSKFNNLNNVTNHLPVYIDLNLSAEPDPIKYDIILLNKMLKNYGTDDTSLISELDLNNDNSFNKNDFIVLKNKWGLQN